MAKQPMLGATSPTPADIEDDAQYDVEIVETIADYGPSRLMFRRGSVIFSGAFLKAVQAVYPNAIGSYSKQ